LNLLNFIFFLSTSQLLADSHIEKEPTVEITVYNNDSEILFNTNDIEINISPVII